VAALLRHFLVFQLYSGCATPLKFPNGPKNIQRVSEAGISIGYKWQGYRTGYL
jgi:hypothetical protein